MDTVHDGFQKLFGGENIIQRAGTVFRQPFRHAVEAVGHCAEFFVPAHVEAFLVIVIGYFKYAVRQFLNRLTDGTGQPNKQHDAGKNAIHSKARCNPGMAAGLSGSVAVKIWRLTTERATSRIIMPERMPTLSINLVRIFIMH